jgi:transcriptional regulator with XRE-family HTH domain
MNSSEIKKLLKESGVTQVSIARKLGVSKEYVFEIIHGIRNSRKVREAIAEAVGRSFDELWKDFRGDLEKNMDERDPYFFSTLIKLKDWDVSRSALYEQANKGKLGYPVKKINLGKRKRLTLLLNREELKDFFDKENTILKTGAQLGGKQIKNMRVKIPGKFEKHLNLIKKVDCVNYRNFYEFIKENLNVTSDTVWELKINRDRHFLIERRIEIYEDDYETLVTIARRCGLTVSLVIEVAL